MFRAPLECSTPRRHKDSGAGLHGGAGLPDIFRRLLEHSHRGKQPPGCRQGCRGKTRLSLPPLWLRCARVNRRYCCGCGVSRARPWLSNITPPLEFSLTSSFLRSCFAEPSTIFSIDCLFKMVYLGGGGVHFDDNCYRLSEMLRGFAC